MINDESLKSLERLHQLKLDGIVTQDDFDAAKAKLLAQKPMSTASTRSASNIGRLPAFDGTFPAENDLGSWALLPLRRYADFNGRSRMKEYWAFQLALTLVLAICFMIAVLTFPSFGALLAFIVIVVACVPALAVQVRRFHDQDLTGWFALLNLIPYLGPCVVLVFMLMKGTDGDNRFGSNTLPEQRRKPTDACGSTGM